MSQSAAKPSAPPQAQARDFALLFLLAAIWGSSFLFIRISVPTIPPFTLAFGRLALGAVLLFWFAKVGGYGLPRRAADWTVSILIGFTGYALPFTLIHWGEITVESSVAAILMGVMPLVTAVMAHYLVSGEPFKLQTLWGMSVGFAGLVVLIGWEAVAGVGEHLVAQIAILIAAISYATNTIIVRRNGHMPGRSLAAGSTLAGTIMMIPPALILEQPWTLNPSPEAWFGVFSLGIFSTGIATIMTFSLIRKVGATVFSQVNYMIPIMGVAWGAMVLGERPAPRALIALMLILIGVALVNSKRK